MAASVTAVMPMASDDLFRGLIRLHVLHHAAREPIYGQAIIDELGRHKYRLSPGTIYPILHALERDRLLQSKPVLREGRIRRTYCATRAGRAALREAGVRMRELFREIFEDELSRAGNSDAAKHKRRRARSTRSR